MSDEMNTPVAGTNDEVIEETNDEIEVADTEVTKTPVESDDEVETGDTEVIAE